MDAYTRRHAVVVGDQAAASCTGGRHLRPVMISRELGGDPDGLAQQVRLFIDHREGLVTRWTGAIYFRSWHVRARPGPVQHVRSLWHPRHLTAVLD